MNRNKMILTAAALIAVLTFGSVLSGCSKKEENPASSSAPALTTPSPEDIENAPELTLEITPDKMGQSVDEVLKSLNLSKNDVEKKELPNGNIEYTFKSKQPDGKETTTTITADSSDTLIGNNNKRVFTDGKTGYDTVKLLKLSLIKALGKSPEYYPNLQAGLDNMPSYEEIMATGENQFYYDIWKKVDGTSDLKLQAVFLTDGSATVTMDIIGQPEASAKPKA